MNIFMMCGRMYSSVLMVSKRLCEARGVSDSGQKNRCPCQFNRGMVNPAEMSVPRRETGDFRGVLRTFGRGKKGWPERPWFGFLYPKPHFDVQFLCRTHVTLDSL